MTYGVPNHRPPTTAERKLYTDLRAALKTPYNIRSRVVVTPMGPILQLLGKKTDPVVEVYHPTTDIGEAQTWYICPDDDNLRNMEVFRGRRCMTMTVAKAAFDVFLAVQEMSAATVLHVDVQLTVDMIGDSCAACNWHVDDIMADGLAHYNHCK